MRPTIQTTFQTGTLLHPLALDLRHQDYLQISQSARTRALVVRRETTQIFWASVVRMARQVVHNFGQHASVRLGAGQRTLRLGA